MQRTSYYHDLAVDYSKPIPVSEAISEQMLKKASTYIALKEHVQPQITGEYPLSQIEQENKDWWPSHCEALRKSRGDLLAEEYSDGLVYFCADGPFYGKDAGVYRERNWWAIISQPGVIMAWPIVMFSGEVVYFEWNCVDNETAEVIAKGSVTWIRRGHRGACHLKAEQLTFYRDIYASSDLMALIESNNAKTLINI